MIIDNASRTHLATVLATPAGVVAPACLSARALLASDLQLSPAMQSAFEDLEQSALPADLARAQLEIVRTFGWDVGVEHFVRAVSSLVLCKHMELNEGARLIARVPYPVRTSLSTAAQRVVDVADAVLEDLDEEIMGIEDDDLFLSAASDLLRADISGAMP